jgi:hypothetical protein
MAAPTVLAEPAGSIYAPMIAQLEAQDKEQERKLLALMAEASALSERERAVDQSLDEQINQARIRRYTLRSRINTLTNLSTPKATPENKHVPVRRTTARPPEDVVARTLRFAERNSPGAIAALANDFFAGMDLSFPGLEAVKKHRDDGRHADALEAYKHYFFEGLAGSLPAFMEANGDDEDAESSSNGEGGFFAVPTAGDVAAALEGVVSEVAEVRDATGKHIVRREVTLGTPGRMSWVLVTPEDIAASPGDNLLRLSKTLNHPQGGTFAVLLHSFGAGGPHDHLARWIEIMDDWAMNWRKDVDASPLALRDYHVLMVHRIQDFREKMALLALLRPEIRDALPATTLARLLIAMNEEYLPMAIRLGRSGLYNFRIMALNSMVPTSIRMREFFVHQWALREGWRQIDNNFIYKTRQDGANFEFANDGHENTDQYLIRALDAVLAWNKNPPWAGPFWVEEFMDNFLSNTRYWVHNLKPDGFSYRLNHRTQKVRYSGEHPEYKINFLQQEDEVRRRVKKVFGIGGPEEEPEILSEGLAFQGYYYLRGGWDPGDAFLYFQNIGQPILSGREDSTGFSLYRGSFIDLLCPPVVVDRRSQNAHYGLVLNPGGKAPFATYGKPNVVQEARFLTHPSFDLVEGVYDGVYQYHRGSVFYDVFGSYDHLGEGARAAKEAAREGRPFSDAPITDVSQHRQIIHVRAHGFYIVSDRFTSDQPREFTQNYTVYTPVKTDRVLERLKLFDEANVPRFTLDAEARHLSTHNPGLPSVQMRHITALPIAYSSKADPGEQAVRDGADPAAVSRKWGKRGGHHTGASGAMHFNHTATVSWRARGPHTLLTLVSQMPATDAEQPSPALLDFQATTPAPDQAGFVARLQDGTPIAYVAASKPTVLTLGEITAHASTLFTMGSEGMALDCTSLTHRGKPVALTGNDFVFGFSPASLVVSVPIYRPIKPVSIHPGINGFTDTLDVTLTCPTQDVEIRYTLDGTRPTRASAKYTQPITLHDTTRIKARAFRPDAPTDVWQQDGTHATTVFSAVFEKMSVAPARPPLPTKPGLSWEYTEGMWTTLMARSRYQPATNTGVGELFDVSMRQTDGAFAVRYTGYFEAP